MTIRTAFWQVGVITGEFAGVKKTFVAAFLKSDNRGDACGQAEEGDEKEGEPSRVNPTIESKIILVSPCDLLLGVFRVIHWQLVIK